jgi:chromosome segregation ATPase
METIIDQLKKQLNEQGKLLLSKNCELISKETQINAAVKAITDLTNDLVNANNKIRELQLELNNAKNCQT